MEISVIVPAYNEEQNIPILTTQLTEVLGSLGREYEILFIDDGSRDSTFNVLKALCSSDKRIRAIRFRRNYGQTAALAAGFRNAKGRIIVTIDADLQNDPRDIPPLLAKLNEGYDAVSGWRLRRRDGPSKVIFSRIASWMRRAIMGETLHDLGCTLKVYRRDCVQELLLYGEMHRFIPTLLRWQGYSVGELVVQHHKRMYGKTKYKLDRVVKGFFDLVSAKFWNDFSTRPFHFFALIGLLAIFLGGLSIIIPLFYNLFVLGKVSVGVWLLPGGILFLSGIQFVLFGFLSEMLVKDYYSQNREEIYKIRERIN